MGSVSPLRKTFGYKWFYYMSSQHLVNLFSINTVCLLRNAFCFYLFTQRPVLVKCKYVGIVLLPAFIPPSNTDTVHPL